MLSGDLNQVKYGAVAGSDASIAVVDAVAGKKIRVLHYTLTSDKEAALIWKSGTTALNGAGVKFAAAGSFADDCPAGLFETGAGAALNLGNAAGAATGGTVTYIEV